MLAVPENLLVIMACLFALLTGLSFAVFLQRRQRRRKQIFRKKVLLEFGGFNNATSKILSSGLVGRILQAMLNRSFILKVKPNRHIFTQGVWVLGVKSYIKVVEKTGLKEEVSKAGFLYVRACSCSLSFCGALLCGALISNELMVFLGLCGSILGWRVPLWALKKEREARKTDLENHLSEMLEVVTLGLRSGLSFDHAFELYHSHFPTHLGTRASLAQKQWQLGLKNREEALRMLAAEYDSVLFARVIENIIRSLRFGGALADSLDASALEARMINKANREEAVAKAPVKMLVPTAALILPAMLLLVLGPVLLEMMQGF